MGNVKLTFEELTTVLSQIEACLNSRPLVALPCNDDGVEALTPGHFLIGRPLEALPNPAVSFRSLSLRGNGICASPWSGTSGSDSPLSILSACRNSTNGVVKEALVLR